MEGKKKLPYLSFVAKDFASGGGKITCLHDAPSEQARAQLDAP